MADETGVGEERPQLRLLPPPRPPRRRRPRAVLRVDPRQEAKRAARSKASALGWELVDTPEEESRKRQREGNARGLAELHAAITRSILGLPPRKADADSTGGGGDDVPNE